MPNVPIKNAGVECVFGLELSRTDDENISIAVGQARDDTNVNDIAVASALTVNNLTAGAGGLDTGSVANSTWYAVYVIGDSLGKESVAGLMSTSETDPTMPAGYDMKKKIGHVLTDATADFLAFSQFGSGNMRQYLWAANINVLAAGAATSTTAVALTTAVPPVRCEAILDVAYTPNSATNVAEIQPFESAATTGIVRFGYGVAAAQVGMARCLATLNSAAPSIEYKVANGSDALTLDVAGWVEDLLG